MGRKKAKKPARPAISYQEYLRSRHWASVRARVLKKHPRCLACHSTKNIQIHHICYRRWEERNQDVTPLCGDCHHAVHEKLNSMYPGLSLGEQVKKTAHAFRELFGREMPAWSGKPRRHNTRQNAAKETKPPKQHCQPEPAKTKKQKQAEQKAKAKPKHTVFRKVQGDLRPIRWQMVINDDGTTGYREDRNDAV